MFRPGRGRWKRFVAGAVVAIAFSAVQAWAQKEFPPPKEDLPKFLRVNKGDDGKPLALETAIVRYQGAYMGKPVTVDLIGAVHIGEKAYYEKLNERFGKYDALLYELVAPPNTRPVKGQERTGNAVSALQNGMKNMLGLEHQLVYVDYDQKNFVHADMSPDELFKSMKDRKESFLTMYFRMVGYTLANPQAQAGSEMKLLLAFFSKDRATALKLAMAEQFNNLGGIMSAIDGKDGSTLIAERNKVALKVLQQELAAGKDNIGIFYGAGHMIDFDKRLTTDFGLEAKETEWVEAWNLRYKK